MESKDKNSGNRFVLSSVSNLRATDVVERNTSQFNFMGGIGKKRTGALFAQHCATHRLKTVIDNRKP